MKRLTFEGNFCDIAECEDRREEDCNCAMRVIWERLKAIEDILGDDYDIDHLREKLAAQSNEPLTLDELRELYMEPIWVVCLKPELYDSAPIRWRILEKSLAGTMGVWDGESCLSEREYGKTWLAYRRPPTENK